MSALFVFPPFRLDVDNARLWLGDEELHLRPKAFAVLCYLIAQQGRLVSREELMHAVWPDIKISDVVLRGCLREVRQVLGDSVHTPQFIETVPRRGWRFISPLSMTRVHSRFEEQSQQEDNTPQVPRPHLSNSLVGREAELAQLQQYLEEAQGNERRVVFVTGEVGIGKTALLDAFLTQAASATDVSTARGQCVEQYGIGEPYLPVLEALGRLGRNSEMKQVIPLLRRHAPMWLLQLPELLETAESAQLRHSLQGAPQDRMLREMAAFVEALTTDRTLLLVLEDLHWSDVSTLSLIAYLARRREAARLLIVGTYRPAEVMRSHHSLRSIVQELTQSRHCREFALVGLSERAVSDYVKRRFPGKTLPVTLSETVYRYTEGNPLFIVNVVEYLMFQNSTAQRTGGEEIQQQLAQMQRSVPDTLRHLIEGQLERLSAEEQRLLEIGSVAGVEFSATIVAAGLEEDIITVEQRCATLARHQLFLETIGTPVDQERRSATRYRFAHSLYHKLVYERLSTARRRQLHLRIGGHKEQAYGERAAEVAAELAVHFEEGRDYPRAVRYLNLAATTAMQRQAPQEARAHLQHALTLLEAFPASAELNTQVREIQRALQQPLLALKNARAVQSKFQNIA
ncbi:MAG: AAA family ATPase [Deltaproteobacteria bacterium]|nr:AAA family ATPase [Deltaproteobacteria bacterium]